MSQLNQFVLYLESSPTEEYLKKEAKNIKNKIADISNRYEEPLDTYGFTKSQLTTMRKLFEKQHNLPKLRKQLANIKYILK